MPFDGQVTDYVAKPLSDDARILIKASEWMAQHGLCKNDFGMDKEGRGCLIRALQAVGGTKDDAVCGRLRDAIREVTGMAAPRWSMEPHTTTADAVRVLRAAAEVIA